MIKKKIESSLFLQILILAGSLIFALILGGVLTVQYIQGTVIDNTNNINEKQSFKIENYMDEQFMKMRNIATSVAYSPNVTEFLNESRDERVIHMENIEDIFLNSYLLDPDIIGIYLYDTNMEKITGYGSDIGNLLTEDKIVTEKMEYSNVCYFEDSDVPYYLIYFPVLDLKNREYGRQIGTCVFLMKTDDLIEKVQELKVTDHTEIYLMDGNGQILQNHFEQWQARKKSLAEDGKFYVTEQQLDVNGWRVMTRIPKSEVDGIKKENTGLFVMVYLFVVLIVLVLVYFFSVRVLRRIRRMETFINESVKHSDLRMDTTEQDELGRVAISLNHMLDDKERLNEKNLAGQKKMYEIEIAEQRAQLMAYRNQINPHFLYNTFECICSMALYYDNEDIAEITMALSRIFRFATKGEEIVKVEDELRYVQEYAKIIECRFMGKIDISIEAEEDVLKKDVIKLLLQPIIENAVFHGLEQKIEEGEVVVSVYLMQENKIQFVVEDNGCGMDKEQIEQLWQTMQKRVSGKGVGLANVYQRLKLFYGEDMQFDIVSELDVGTKITIIVPDHIEEKKHESI